MIAKQVSQSTYSWGLSDQNWIAVTLIKHTWYGNQLLVTVGSEVARVQRVQSKRRNERRNEQIQSIDVGQQSPFPPVRAGIGSRKAMNFGCVQTREKGEEMDYKGQKLAETLYIFLLVAAAVVAWFVGWYSLTHSLTHLLACVLAYSRTYLTHSCVIACLLIHELTCSPISYSFFFVGHMEILSCHFTVGESHLVSHCYCAFLIGQCKTNTLSRTYSFTYLLILQV